MDKATTRVGVLMGGLSGERPISLKSGAGVLGALQERGWNAIGIDVGRDLPQQLIANKIDVAYLALHGKFGEDGCVQGLLEIMGIPYTGSGVQASAVCMDKIATKRVLRGIKEVIMAADAVVQPDDAWPAEVPFPAVVKPPTSGSTLGITRVTSPEEVKAAFDLGFTLDPELLIEEFVEGEEITVAVVDGKPLPVVRILPESGFFDFEAKYTKGKTVYECPAKIPDSVAKQAQIAARAAFIALGCRGLARADFIIRASDNVPVFLEINTIPGMTATSLSPMAAAAVGVTYPELCEKILLHATNMPAEVVSE